MTSQDQPEIPPATNPDISEAARIGLRRIWETIDRLMDEEDGDRQLIVEMTQEMLTDLATTGLNRTVYYVERYSDLTGEDAKAAALDIDNQTFS